MNRCFALISLSLLTAIGQTAYTADDLGGGVDLRLGYETFNTKYRLRYPGVDSDENMDITHRITLTWIGTLGLRSNGGWLWGLGGSWLYTNDNLPGAASADQRFTYQNWEVQGHLGYGWPITTRTQIEIIPYVGFGRAYVTSEGSSSSPEGTDDTYDVGFNLNGTYTFDNGVQLGVNGRYFLNETGITDEASGDRYSFHILDFTVGAFIGVRL